MKDTFPGIYDVTVFDFGICIWMKDMKDTFWGICMGKAKVYYSMYNWEGPEV